MSSEEPFYLGERVVIHRDALVATTSSQRHALVRILDEPDVETVLVGTSFDLPNGYITFCKVHAHRARGVNGGIAPDGSVST